MSFARKEPRANPTEGFRFAKPSRAPKAPKQLRPRQAAPGEPRKFSTLSRTRMKRNPKTKQQLREVVFAPYERWLLADGARCVVCGTPENIQRAHVGIGGMGMKNGTAADKIRLCGPHLGDIGCHARFDQTARPWTRATKAIFARHQRLAHWEAFLGWAGIEIHRLSLNGDDDVHALIDCDAMIAACVARLGGGT